MTDLQMLKTAVTYESARCGVLHPHVINPYTGTCCDLVIEVRKPVSERLCEGSNVEWLVGRWQSQGLNLGQCGC
jgi:hypothetical protein